MCAFTVTKLKGKSVPWNPKGLKLFQEAGFKNKFICSLGKADHFVQELHFVTLYFSIISLYKQTYLCKFKIAVTEIR